MVYDDLKYIKEVKPPNVYNQRQCFATAHIKLVVYFFVILTIAIIITTFIFTTLSLISVLSLLLEHP